MTIRILNSSIHTMDNKFCPLIAADMTRGLNGFCLRFGMKACSLSIAPFYIPSAIRIVNHMMFGSSYLNHLLSMNTLY